MTRYERHVIAVDDNGGFDIEGNIIAVLDSPQAGKRTVTALVEVPETESQTPTPTTFNSDNDTDTDTPPKLTFFCQGKKSNGEPCSREVDEAGDYCWQHSSA